MKPLKEKISITLDGDTLQKIKEKAEAEDRSLSQYINLVLRRHLQAQDTQHCEKNKTCRCIKHHKYNISYQHVYG